MKTVVIYEKIKIQKDYCLRTYEPNNCSTISDEEKEMQQYCNKCETSDKYKQKLRFL